MQKRKLVCHKMTKSHKGSGASSDFFTKQGAGLTRSNILNSFSGGEQPQMITLLLCSVRGQLVLRGHVILGPDVLGRRVTPGSAVREEYS